jgi:N-acetylmuramoyl-L-alanine amidase
MVGLVGMCVAASKRFTLVIDAGHGGHDAGAVGAITKEKAINLNVALAFGRLVERNCPDVKVIYTRKTDVFVPLHVRADIANKNKADLFISIHTNSLPRGRVARGIETYTLGMHRAADNLAVAKRENEVILYEKDYKQRYQGFDPNSSESYIMFEFMQDHNMAQSVELAKYVQRRTCSLTGRQNKGVKQAGFLVLRETSMPSCLIELGFISTADEERFLHSDNGVSQLGQGIYQAFLDYKRKHDNNISVPYKADEPKQEVDIPQVVPERPVKETPAEPVKPVVSAPVRVVETLQVKSDSVSAKEEVAPVKKEVLPMKNEVVPAKNDGAPIFKVQILASSSRLKPASPQLKGQTGADYYEEGGLFKYTIGASEDYSEISRLRKSLLVNFPEAFIIAFKGGQKMDVRQAIQEFRNRKK